MSGIQITYIEKDIEDLLEEDCEHYVGLKFITRQFRTPVGIIDVIARQPHYNRRFKMYYVIEIKKGTLDAAAYVQLVRYTNWLNSERSKDGNRIFVGVLIGSSLAEDLIKVCEYFDPSEHGWHTTYRKIFYRIFKFDPKRGVGFFWSNNAQANYTNSLKCNYDHIQEILDREDRAEQNNFSLQRENSDLKELLELKAQNISELSSSIRLVKTDGDAA